MLAQSGELVSAVLFRAPAPLVDIGANLVDHSFEKVEGRLTDLTQGGSFSACTAPHATAPLHAYVSLFLTQHSASTCSRQAPQRWTGTLGLLKVPTHVPLSPLAGS